MRMRRERATTHEEVRRSVDRRRISGPWTVLAVAGAAVAALGSTLATVVAGRLAEHTTAAGVWLIAAMLIGAAVADTAGRMVWATIIDRAAGQLRADLLDAVFGQPLAVLTEQASGEVLDRIDDDTHELATLLNRQMWMLMRMGLSIVPLWVIAGVTWWPAWFLFPVFGVLTYAVMRPLLTPIKEGKVVEEAAWTDHAAALEEAIAGRDDVRTSLGQSFVVARVAKLSARVHDRFAAVLRLECRLLARTGFALHLLLVAIVVAGIAMARASAMSVADLVTIFLVASSFVGLMSQLAEQLPDVQAGLGALVRLRTLMASPQEPVGGEPMPEGELSLEFRELSFQYEQGAFGLQDVSFTVPAGATVALVGRTGSGKSTLASLLSRAVEPPEGQVFLGGVDVTTLDLEALRARVGVVTQRTEILAGTVAENIALFADVPRDRIEEVVASLGMDGWVAGLPEGLETTLGPGGLTLSAGEEQLLAFARILVRDVSLVVLDEATARMDPVTEARVVAAARRLLEGRTGVVIAHRLSTIERADYVAVMDRGRLAEFGARSELLSRPGHFADLVTASREADGGLLPSPSAAFTPGGGGGAAAAMSSRRMGDAPEPRDVGSGPSLARGIRDALSVRPWWGLVSVVAFLIFSVAGASGGLTGWAWGNAVDAANRDAASAWGWTAAVVVFVLLGPAMLVFAVSRYPRWWIEVSLRVRMALLIGQTDQRRMTRTPPGEVVARGMDSDRFVRYADRWVDFINGIIIVVMTAVVGGTYLAGLVLLVILVASAVASMIGRSAAGKSATAASATRARFGRILVSSLDAARTVKLAGRMAQVGRHLAEVDAGRVRAAVREHRIQAGLDGVPTLMVQCGIVAAWAGVLHGTWGLATALLVVNAATNFTWFGRVAGAVVTEAPGVRSWQAATSELAGGANLTHLPAGIDLVAGQAPDPPEVGRVPLERLELDDFAAVHEDGTLGVSDVDLTVRRGELVLLLGRVGSGKSSLLAALAGLVGHTGGLRWNGRDVTDPEVFLRPGQVAYVAQTPRVMSGTFADNVTLGFDRDFDTSVTAARLLSDVKEAGGPNSVIGHRGVRLSGGQVQRLALARALAADTELLLADDVSSALDARTEVELWNALRERGVTVVGATSKRSALARADRVVVLVDGCVAASGPWSQLRESWAHLAG